MQWWQGAEPGWAQRPAWVPACCTGSMLEGTALRAEPSGGFSVQTKKTELLGLNTFLVTYSFKKYIGFYCFNGNQPGFTF